MEATGTESAGGGSKAGVVLLVVGLIVGLLAGYLSGALLSPGGPTEEATFTVVAYHWGFAIYDEDGVEVPKMEVAKGTEVTLMVIGAESLSHEFHETYAMRTTQAWADNPAFENKNATEIHELMEEAEDQGLIDHSVKIAEFNIDVKAEGESPSPAVVTFIADKTGTFDIQCNVICGWGHQYMKLSGGIVVS